MSHRLILACVLALAPATSAAQGLAAMQPIYDDVKGNILKSADLMPAENYGFKPTPEVRSFGQLLGHIANANFVICATAKGEKSPATQDFEKNTEKAALVKALNDAFAYCDPVYKMTEASLSATAEMFGMKQTRLGWAFMNVTHDNLHYGNVITYLRLKGITPPSSRM
jgi:uncharacterized damage-inducible protein DinB